MGSDQYPVFSGQSPVAGGEWRVASGATSVKSAASDADGRGQSAHLRLRAQPVAVAGRLPRRFYGAAKAALLARHGGERDWRGGGGERGWEGKEKGVRGRGEEGFPTHPHPTPHSQSFL